MKLGIHADILQRWPEVDPVLLRRVLANHTDRDGYRLALIHPRGDRRYDLDGQPEADRVQTHKEREERCRQQREIERRNREAKAALKAEHERIQQEIAARKVALIAQGITPESRSERKRRLAREATEHAARKAQGPRPAPDRPAVQGFPRPAPRPARDETDRAEHPARTPDHAAPAPDRPAPQVEFRKKRWIVLPSDER